MVLRERGDSAQHQHHIQQDDKLQQEQCCEARRQKVLLFDDGEGHEQQQQQQQQPGQRVSTPQAPATPDQTEHFARQSNLVTLLRQSLPQCLPQQPQRRVWRCLMDYPRESPLTCTVPTRPLDISLEEAQLLLESFWLSAAPKPCNSDLMDTQPLSKFAQHLLQVEAADAEAARHFFLSDAEFFQRESCGSCGSCQPGSPPPAADFGRGNEPYHSHADDEEWERQAGWEGIAWTPSWRLLLQLLLCTSCLRAAQPSRSGRSGNVSQPSSSLQRHAAKACTSVRRTPHDSAGDDMLQPLLQGTAAS